ncbi:hypothetical protein BN1708_015497 [Verticillium longisporum]|uniref:Rho-GAP domain-containing protein n=1 Tax=Verticillium longisporum TaxID=100787 RepID=A0A0G4M4E5_VERLO|nr:hypothetical protein BN1708_015497 [Verticillium longisporum]
MQSYNRGSGCVPNPSFSTKSSKEIESETQKSHAGSTAPTSFLVPHSMPVSRQSSASRYPRLANSDIVPAPLTGSGHRTKYLQSSATWTSSSGDLAMFSDTDEIEDRQHFVVEYNRLAKKRDTYPSTMTEKRKWWSKILRTPSTEEREHTEQAAGHIPRHRRSVSDLALKMMHGRKEPQKRLSLQTMVRLGGKSMFYLPAEYAPGALMLPTCIRATAQYLAQHGLVTRGVFRIPGSQRIVNALFDYYCFEGQNEEVARTVRCPNLPTHISAGPHDIASAFKKFLGVLPGGILGSLGLFDALVAIHSQSRAEPEFIRTRQTKIRGRLIALAIGTLQSQFHRELVCAVFGLLSLVGRQAEIAPHEDGLGHPLPTSDLMGYSALGIIFGPLLIGDLLDTYNIRVAHPSSGLLLFPMTPTKLKKERSRSKTMVSEHSPTVDKILIANEIAEMIITHWRDVVRNLRSLSVLAGKGRSKGNSNGDLASRRGFLRSSASEPFKLKRPPGWEDHSPDMPGAGRTGSPTLDTPTPAQRRGSLTSQSISNSTADILSIRRTRPKSSYSDSITKIPPKSSLNPLSPTAEESVSDYGAQKWPPESTSRQHLPDTQDPTCATSNMKQPLPSTLAKMMTAAKLSPAGKTKLSADGTPRQSVEVTRNSCTSGNNRAMPATQPMTTPAAKSRSSQDATKPRSSTKASPSLQTLQSRMLCQSTASEGGDESENIPPSRRSPVRSPFEASKKSGLPQSDSGLVSSRLRRFMKTDQEGWPEQGIVEPVPSRGQGRSSEESKITARQVASPARGQGEHQGIQKSTTFPKRKPVARSADVRNSSLSDRRGIIAADVEVESRSLEQRNTSGAGSNQTVRINSNMHEESVAEREKERENSMQITPKEFFKEFDVAMREPVHTDVSRTNSLEAQ